ncbi:DUF1015 domain-containing protein [Blastococcus sp. CT_GayMR20]|uniref:DUF1015 domain-containing protein n=1 Tax=Blastococcus sp. CT_GayMR20 TaxID=2559609 RepID=UPI001FD7AB79|nr:DUF1015 domain-containing protein [Blastococcus sp. CT_GayMR20]
MRPILPLVDRSPSGSAPSTAVGSAELAAETLANWIRDGILERDAAPAMWLYELRPAGGAPATVGWLGVVALPPAGSSAVLPHEDTFPVAVEGRRALLAATATDLEPIVLAHDPEPVVAELTDRARTDPPTLELRDTDDVLHRLWRETDPQVLSRLTEALGRTHAVIADGHHRFAAARANSRSQPAVAGSDAVLALVTPMGAGGLRVDPIHRVVPDLTLDAAVAAASQGFRVTELARTSSGGTSDVAVAVRRWLDDPRATGFLATDGSRLVQLQSPSGAVLAAVPPEAPAAWRGLDVVLAHHGLLDLLWHRRDDPESVLIAHTVGEALGAAVERSGVALLLRAPSPADVAAVARAGARMPRKSTLFVPKPRTGLVLRPLAD